MLVQNSDDHEESSVKTLNLENVHRNTSVRDSDEGGGDNDRCNNLLLEDKLGNVAGNEQFQNVIEERARDKFILPEGYQILPEEFFQMQGIPPPLVCSSWLKLLNSDGESEEDSIPLAKLKKNMKKKKKLKKNVKSSLDSEHAVEVKKASNKRRKQKADNVCTLINRKRGRPKKQPIEKPNISKDNEFDNIGDESCWENETIYSKDDTPNLSEVEFIEEIKNGQVENKITEEPELEKKKEKKKKAGGVQGVKNGNSKSSFPCTECGKSFSAASTLKCHQRIHNGTLLTCPECHKGFISKYLLKCHMRIHNGDLFMCHNCRKGFTTAELLKVHSRSHTGDRPFACDICWKSFPTSSNMLQHKQIHNSEKKFLCSVCGSSYVQKRCLDYHMLTHEEKKNICSVCGKLWARKSDLNEHMRVHTGVKPYCCAICPQKFSQASSLRRHQLVHMDIKPVSCDTCNKMFKCQEYYKRHLRKHEKKNCAISKI